MEILKLIFRYSGILLLLFCVVLYIKNFVKAESDTLKYFIYYLVVTFCVQLYSMILAHFGENNLYLSHFYFVPQFLLLSCYYKKLFSNFQKKIVNGTLVIVLIILAFQYVMTPSLFAQFNVLEIFITSFPIVVYSIMHLYNSLTKKGDYLFINAAVLLYLSTSTLVFILGDYFATLGKSKLVVNIWDFNRVVYIVFLLLILAEWKTSIKPIKNKYRSK